MNSCQEFGRTKKSRALLVEVVLEVVVVLVVKSKGFYCCTHYTILYRVAPLELLHGSCVKQTAILLLRPCMQSFQRVATPDWLKQWTVL